MQVLTSNDRRVYNLSAGKSLPQWITNKKRRKLEQKDVDIRRRIELMQGCDMPAVSNTVCFSRDGRFLLATGTYPPVVKCFDLDELSEKFKRGLNSEVIKMVVLTDDFSKFVMLEEDRFIEFHTKGGFYHKLRIPHYGRDMAFCRQGSQLYIPGAKGEIFRLHLEEGRFMEPLKSNSDSLNCCAFNDHHQLFVCGTSEGKVEAWDYRTGSRVKVLNCFPNDGIDRDYYTGNGQTAEVTALQYKGALNMGVGLSSGHVLLYDIRSSHPYYVKDHKMGLHIKKIDFVSALDGNLVLSMDSRILKIWQEKDGEPFAAIEPGNDLNDFCLYPNSGLMFLANDSTKLHQFFVPSLGPAPKWCSHLEGITEELEETEQPAVYDDYKFVTKLQLEEIGLSHLIGTSMLRAYMHGYFIDVRLYEQARTLTQPLAFENYKKRKLQEYIDDERKVQVIKNQDVKLPKINRALAMKLQNELSIETKAKKASRKAGKASAAEMAENLLTDPRFKEMFENPEFEIDESSEKYREMMPKLKKLEEKKTRKLEESARIAAQKRLDEEEKLKQSKSGNKAKSLSKSGFDFGGLGSDDEKDSDEDFM